MSYFGRLTYAFCGRPYKGDAEARKARPAQPQRMNGVPVTVGLRGMEDMPLMERLGKYDDALSQELDSHLYSGGAGSPVGEATASSLHYARQILRGCFPELVLRAALKEDEERAAASRK